MHLALPMLLAAILAGAGTYGVIARRNAVLVLIGVELILNAANVILVALGAADDSPLQVGQSLTLFVITIAAAEICVALAVVLAMFRVLGHVDLTRVAAADDDGETAADTDGAGPAPESVGKARR
ncbi:NADH-quinone oxidoreductase subunit NuoK [Lapillicoccus sp.]|uniref:NADH-quinone oxidoreductase subunit NuoK n=1 Tax=Lapillicoccus sp. TaxID=1909287 RepID=UPI0027C28404|nr:NADH-quinone oxidoreductase subunit NuoK [Actinomycetota bacterium]